MLDAATIIETSNSARIKAADRAVTRKAPCHTNKNSVADAILIETYFECVRTSEQGDKFAFVTHNYSDFSVAGGSRKLPHVDLEMGFNETNSFYFITLKDCLRSIDEGLVSFLVPEQSFESTPRTLTEIYAETERLTHQSSYARHSKRQQNVRRGRHKIVSNAEWDASFRSIPRYALTHTDERTWERSERAQAIAAVKLGESSAGPYSTYKLGFVEGRLAGLRWVLGDDFEKFETPSRPKKKKPDSPA